MTASANASARGQTDFKSVSRAALNDTVTPPESRTEALIVGESRMGLLQSDKAPDLPGFTRIQRFHEVFPPRMQATKRVREVAGLSAGWKSAWKRTPPAAEVLQYAREPS